MKTDLYTKVVLTIIAACLLGLVFRDVPTITTAYAETATQLSVPQRSPNPSRERPGADA